MWVCLKVASRPTVAGGSFTSSTPHWGSCLCRQQAINSQQSAVSNALAVSTGALENAECAAR